MIAVTKDKAQLNLLDLLGKHIATRGPEIEALLVSYGSKLPKGIQGKGLLTAVFEAIEAQDEKFHRALAALLYGSREEGEDHFNMGNLLGQGASAAASEVPTSGGGITVGSDPVSAIAGAIGSVANIFGNHQNRKTLKMQAQSKTLQSMLAYKTQKEQQVAAEKAAANQKQWYQKVGILAGVGGIGILLILQMRKRPHAHNQSITSDKL